MRAGSYRSAPESSDNVGRSLLIAISFRHQPQGFTWRYPRRKLFDRDRVVVVRHPRSGRDSAEKRGKRAGVPRLSDGRPIPRADHWGRGGDSQGLVWLLHNTGIEVLLGLPATPQPSGGIPRIRLGEVLGGGKLRSSRFMALMR